MPILILLLASAPVPKVENPETVLHKFDNFDFGKVNLSIHKLNTLEMNKEFYTGKRLQIEGDGSWNIMTREQEATFQISWRFK